MKLTERMRNEGRGKWAMEAFHRHLSALAIWQKIKNFPHGGGRVCKHYTIILMGNGQ